MKYVISAFLLFTISISAIASDAGDCTKSAGSYLTGTVVSAPVFKDGTPLKGISLSHTQLTIKADSNSKIYEVAIDNVFAQGYTENKNEIPKPLNSIKVGDKLSLCGQLYTQGTGIHWVHTNCGKTPTSNKPNGWVKKINPNGTTTENYESLTSYCYLWK